jgi:hypothetical protein
LEDIMVNRATKMALAAAALALSAGFSGAANAGTRYYYGFGYGSPYLPAAHEFYVQLADPYDYYPVYVPVFRFGDIQGLHRLERMR